MAHKVGLLKSNTLSGSSKASPKEFRQITSEISTMLAFEATKDLHMQSQSSSDEGQEIRVAIVPIMRSGMGMVSGFSYLHPDAEVWHLGLYRDANTMVPVEYYNRWACKVAMQTTYLSTQSREMMTIGSGVSVQILAGKQV